MSITPRALENNFPQADLSLCLVSPALGPCWCHHPTFPGTLGNPFGLFGLAGWPLLRSGPEAAWKGLFPFIISRTSPLLVFSDKRKQAAETGEKTARLAKVHKDRWKRGGGRVSMRNNMGRKEEEKRYTLL